MECRHSVFEEVNLTFSFDIQTVLEAMTAASCDRQTVPVVDHSLREEVKTTITATAIRRRGQESSFKENDN